MDKNNELEKELRENEVAAANDAHSHPDPISGEAESKGAYKIPKSSHPDPELDEKAEEIVEFNSDGDK